MAGKIEHSVGSEARVSEAGIVQELTPESLPRSCLHCFGEFGRQSNLIGQARLWLRTCCLGSQIVLDLNLQVWDLASSVVSLPPYLGAFPRVQAPSYPHNSLGVIAEPFLDVLDREAKSRGKDGVNMAAPHATGIFTSSLYPQYYACLWSVW